MTVVGVDIGATKTHLALARDGAVTRERILATREWRPHRTDPSALLSLIRDLAAGGFQVTLSLELFNRKLWSQDPLTVLETGLAKMKALVEGSRDRAAARPGRE